MTRISDNTHLMNVYNKVSNSSEFMDLTKIALIANGGDMNTETLSIDKMFSDESVNKVQNGTYIKNFRPLKFIFTNADGNKDGLLDATESDLALANLSNWFQSASQAGIIDPNVHLTSGFTRSNPSSVSSSISSASSVSASSNSSASSGSSDPGYGKILWNQYNEVFNRSELRDGVAALRQATGTGDNEAVSVASLTDEAAEKFGNVGAINTQGAKLLFSYLRHFANGEETISKDALRLAFNKMENILEAWDPGRSYQNAGYNFSSFAHVAPDGGVTG